MAMILDAAFTSMPDMMTAYRKIPIVRPFARFPFLLNHFKMRLTDRFETVRAIETIISPLLLIHGQEDADVLISNSHTLFHTALSARRLNSSGEEFIPNMVKENDTMESNMNNVQTEIPLQHGHSTSQNIQSSAKGSLRQRFQGGEDLQTIDRDSLQEATKSMNLKGLSSPIESDIGNSGEEMSDNGETIKSMQHIPSSNVGLCNTVQLDFPREGSLEYNQTHQIGFLTVQYAVHNTCMDFSISREVLESFQRTVENRRGSCLNGIFTSNNVENSDRNTRDIDLAKILCSGKNGYVDQSEVPEVVE
ncbi:hypothetical protein BGZ76_007538 [Entomortierella beljakovae]|nr:hypothetical protein BGZ76_007538 [Entomortierella beljakovae]